MTEANGQGTRIGVVGCGLLGNAITTAFDEHVAFQPLPGSLPAQTGRGCALLVAAADGWASGYGEVRRSSRQASIPWLPVRTELGNAIIGPIELPDEAGCVDCAELRRSRVRIDPAGHDAVWRRHRDRLADRPSAWLTELGAHLVASLVVEDAERLGNGLGPLTRRALLRVDLEHLTVSRHRFLPDPLCPICGQAPDDTPDAARIVLSSRPANPPGSYRTRAVRNDLLGLVDTYVDPEAGLIRSLTDWSSAGLVVAAAQLRLRNGHGEAGYGRGSSYQASRLTALLEALERYGSTPGGRRTTVRASYAEIADCALDPRTLGPHPPECYRLQSYLYRPFSTTRPYTWVWGYSFGRQEPILVPESCAYYGVHHAEADGPPFIYEISNGCALGGCLEEAILYGLLEVAERDAFLLTWYARLPAPRIDIHGARDHTLPLLAAAIRADTGYEVLAFDISLEQRIPCAWAMAVNPTTDGRPAIACAAGAHLDPEQAVRNALNELGPGLHELIRRYPDEADRAHRMAADPTLVTAMEDHPLLYADPGAATRLGFLTSSRQLRRIEAMGGPDRGGFLNTDLRDNLLEAVDRYLRSGLDVIVVDQTAPEHRAGRFACVKVLVPGTLPMTFGHHHRRVDGLPRLSTVPQLLGYRDRPLRAQDINPHPHPFP